LNIGQVITELRNRGRIDEADKYEQSIMAKFGELPKEEIYNLDVDVLSLTIQILTPANKPVMCSREERRRAAYRKYADSLRQRGFFVSLGEKYC
jgi:hypothetical protein